MLNMNYKIKQIDHVVQINFVIRELNFNQKSNLDKIYAKLKLHTVFNTEFTFHWAVYQSMTIIFFGSLS